MENNDKIDIDNLVDIKNVNINPVLDKEKRVKSFLEQIKNPLCYRCGEYVVKISFSNNNRTIEDCFEDYLKNL